MTHSHESNFSDETDDQDRAEQNGETEQLDESDMDITQLPNGDMLYSARLIDESGSQNVVSLKKSAEHGVEVVINGNHTSDEESVQKVIELFGVDEQGETQLDAQEAAPDSLASREATSVAQEIKDDVTREMRQNNPKLSPDRTMVDRRTSEVVGNATEKAADSTQEQQIIDGVRREELRTERAVLAEELIGDKNAEVAEALADALRKAGDGSGASRLEKLAFDANHATGGARQLENNDSRLQEFGKEAEIAMRATNTTVEELEDQAEQKKAA